MSAGRSWRKALLPLLLTWLCVSLACNFPTPTRTPTGGSTPLGEGGSPLPAPGGAPGGTDAPFAGVATATPAGTPPENPAATPTLPTSFSYDAQSGDTLAALARRFGVEPAQIASTEAIPAQGLIPPGQRLSIPNTLGAPPYPSALLPDSEVVDSPSTVGFSVQDFVAGAGGYLNAYRQWVGSESLSGAAVVERVAQETSTNPRLLLALIELRSGWVYASPPTPDLAHPLDLQVSGYQGLYLELSVAAKLLNIGYYGWRQGALTTLNFTDGGSVRLAPQLNAGSVALQYLFARLYAQSAWLSELYGTNGLPALYAKMFGNPWARAAAIEPLLPAGLQAPNLELPFAPGERWSFTAGPHPDWNTGTPPGALDFAPITGEPPCAVSSAWARAAAPGVVVRAGNGAVLLDLDGDGHEQTGWVLLYLHIADAGRVAVGAHVNTDDPIGHPSCEGGDATGTNLHLARKYNGEWVSAGEPLPFALSGWTALPGAQPYDGTLVKGDQIVTAHPDGSHGSTIVR